jgi:hypothetical protein
MHKRFTGFTKKSRAKYTYNFTEGILHITDLSEAAQTEDDEHYYMSVTNDIENVLHDIHKETQGDLSLRCIVYRDTLGMWDGIKANNAGTLDEPRYTKDFYPIQAKTLPEALEHVKNILKNCVKS